MRQTRWMVTAGVALVCAASAFAAGGKERLPVGEFTARRLAAAPTMDGVLAPGKRDKALISSGMMTPFDHSLQEAATTVGFGFDEENFYFLFHGIRGDREWKLWKSVRENDGYSFGDPSIEIWVTPPTLVPETYQNVINTYPAVLDQKMIPTRGYTAQGWKGNWDLGVTESDTEYVLEAAAPIKDFGFDSVKDGDVWRFLLCRTSPGTQSRAQASWSITQGFAELGQHPPVRLTDDAPVVQLRDVTSVLSGKYRFPVAVVAPDGRDAEVTVEVRWHKEKKFADDDKVETKTVAAKKGQRAELVFEGDVTAMQKGNFTITATEKGAAIFRQSFPFVVSGWTPKQPVRPDKAREAKELDLMVQYGPVNNVMLLRADIIDLPTREQVAGGTVRLKDPAAEGKVLLEESLPSFIEWYSSKHFSLGKVKVPVADYAKIESTKQRNANKEKENKKRVKRGQEPLPLDSVELPDAKTLVVEVAVQDADGKALKTESKEISLRRYRFKWENNDIGVTDQVIPPWTPVTYADGTVGVWNRNMAMTGLGLLKSVDNGGTDQVRRMRLVAVKDGKEVEITASAPALEQEVDAKVVFSGTGTAAGLSLSARTRVEFDGFVLSDLTIAPQDPAAGAGVDKLFLEVVLTESEATHFCTTAGGWAAAHDETPEYWSSRQTASGMLIGDFVPYVWLSNSDRAFLWFADNDKGWITDDDKSLPTQEVIRRDGTVTLRVHFIEIPTELKEATTLRYGYQCFPSRPLPPGWRSIICNQGKTYLPGAPNTYFWFDGDWAVLWPYYCSPFPWSLEKSKAQFDRYPRNSDHRPMVGSIAHSIGRYRDYEANTFEEYVVDWGDTPGDRSNANVASGRGPNDFRLYHYQLWVREAGFRGLYVDENYLALDKNFLTGGAYIREDGRLQPGYSYLGLREYFKRMKIMFHQNDVPSPNLWQHISSGAAYNSWFGDIFFEGENVEPTDEKFDYIEVLPAGRMRAIGSATCAGGAMAMMCQSQRHATVFEPKHTHQFWGWVMAHDVLPEQVREYEIVAQEAGLYKDDVDFIGYWKADSPFKTKTPECVVSAHVVGGEPTPPSGHPSQEGTSSSLRAAGRRPAADPLPGGVARVREGRGGFPRRALLWIVNTARKDQSVDVSVDMQKLGFDPARAVALNAETGEPVTLGKGGFTIPVLKRDFAAVHLVERQTLKGGESLYASFDTGRDADESLGSSMFVPTGRMGLDEQIALVEGVNGKALGVKGAVALWPHLHVTDEEGRVRFQARIPDRAIGGVFAAPPPSYRYPTRERVPGLRIALEKKEMVFGTIEPGKAKPGAGEVRGERPAPGRHEFDLAWKDGKAVLKVDGKEFGSLPIQGLNICQGTGKALLDGTAFTFGDAKRSAVTAIDEVRCWRTAE